MNSKSDSWTNIHLRAERSVRVVAPTYVFIAGRRQAEIDKAIAEIGKNVTGVRADISKLDDLDRLYESVAKKGKIDVLFAGAAFVEKQMTAAVTPEHFDKTFGTNARGTYFTVQKALPYHALPSRLRSRLSERRPHKVRSR